MTSSASQSRISVGQLTKSSTRARQASIALLYCTVLYLFRGLLGGRHVHLPRLLLVKVLSSFVSASISPRISLRSFLACVQVRAM